MKKLFAHTFIILSLMTSAIQSEATPSVQRTLDSSLVKYLNYLKTNQVQSFMDAYIEMSLSRPASSVSIEDCLESAFLGQPNQEICMKAVQGLTAAPLNPESREILFELLKKLDHFPQMKVFKMIKEGLLSSHPELGGEISKTKKSSVNSFSQLERKAFEKLMAQKINGNDFQVLMNGEKVASIKKWNPLEGIFQWSLVSNTHKPFILVSTFSQFAASVAKDLSPFATSCEGLDDFEIQSLGLLQVEVFANASCIAKDKIYEKPEHLTSLPAMKPSSTSNRNAWIWTAAAIVGVGLASSLKGKNVKVSWPSSH